MKGALLFTGCASEEAPAPQTPHSFGTFNAGLLHNTIPYDEERAPAVGAALAALDDVDVLCLQEVWGAEQTHNIIAQLESRFPYSFSVDTTVAAPTGPAACTAAETDSLLDCVQAGCLDAPSLAYCVLQRCATDFLGMSAPCQRCVVGNVALDIADGVAACQRGPGGLIHQGHNGVVLLSRLPMVATNAIDLDSTAANRVVLHAEIAEFSVFCTHLTASLVLPYQGEFGSWDGERLHQAEQILAYVDEVGADGNIIIGDVNTGPAIGAEIEAEFPVTYERFVAAGFQSSFVRSPSPKCSFCADNTLHMDVSGPDSTLIDHIFIRGIVDEPAEASRILDQPVAILVQGDSMQTNLSDHYGVVARLE